MQFTKSPLALAALALLAGTPLAANAISVSFRAPSSGATLNNVTWNQSSACEVGGSDIRRTEFFLVNSSGRRFDLNNDTSSPYRCNLVSANYANGNYSLRVYAYDSAGRRAGSSRNITIRNGTVIDARPTISFAAPGNNATVGTVTTCRVDARDDRSIRQVQFFMDGTLFRTDDSSSYTCTIDNRLYRNGAHTLMARVTDSAGQTAESQITINITGGISTTPTPTPDTTAPTVQIDSPVSGQKVVAGTPFATTANDNVKVAKVDLYLESGTTRKLAASKDTAPYTGTLDTTGLPSGTATLMAIATDSAGLSATTQRSVTIDNTSSTPTTPPTDPVPPSGGGTPTTLPSTNARAVPTFESLGMYWRPASNPGAAGCSVRFRKTTDSTWRQGFPMWYDSRNGECRGSIVQLAPGTDYTVEMGVGTTFQAGVNTKTWSDTFPIGRTVQVQSGSQTLQITEGGTPDAYVLYTGPATIDVANAQDYNVVISAPYVIVRGLTLRGARIHGVSLLNGAKDVVIEDNDISGWGRDSGNVLGGVRVGTNQDSAIRADCAATPFLERAVIQRNKLHHPRYGANSWDYGHPLGPTAINFGFCGGNHVIRYNEIYSSDGKFFKDGMGGAGNFTANGFPVADTDIYGNRIMQAWDDAISSEGGNRNVRIWGNYIDQTAVGIATTVVHDGPLYMFRNVYNRSRKLSAVSLDADQRLSFAKSGTLSNAGGGRRYVFHNTLLQATQSGLQYPLGAGVGIVASAVDEPVTNTMSRNNILHVWKASADSIRTQGGTGNDFNYDLRNGGISAYAGAEPNGIVGTPIYAEGHGASSKSSGLSQLAPHSAGYDGGARLPNFNDAFTGAAPDIGAHEAGTAAMRFGVR
jgi:hypothetical protein